ncbi:MAG: AAA family ATPase [Tannerellaceae bacterium]|jgi:exonuclease SbcC|nr:AAA family ATPase [Tannerellaceae bacterium]
MKVLAIRGKNIASLEAPFELDFTHEPLASAGIFAITGNTGSGKSTLLDTLCLSLFDKTPRTSGATENNVALPDVKDKTIRQDDSRILLRRGSAEGYAETDFISLSGERYRSTWFVKRARGKVDGALQNSEVRLLNLDTGHEEQGRKSEILVRIVELIGLTFEQFTRAVLLAQGDFATFLKSRRAEKAELLEKLTGTEVYSRISIMIYEKTRTAETEYLKVKERVQNIELMPEETLAACRDELIRLRESVAVQKAEMTIIDAKIKWLRVREEIATSLHQAETAMNDISRKITESAPRFAFIKQVETARGIRDKFNEHQRIDRQLHEFHTTLEMHETENEKRAKQLQEAETLLATLEKEKTDNDHEWEQLQPIINQARTLDIQITNTSANLEDITKEMQKAMAEKKTVEHTIASTRNETETAQTLINTLEAWFTTNSAYQTIIQQIDLITSLLDDLNITTAKKNELLTSCERETTRLAHLQSQRDTLQAELHSMGNIPVQELHLSAEMLALRSGLIDGHPCPLCGSEHHPAQNISAEQADKARAMTEELKRITTETEQLKTIITGLETSIINYENRHAEILDKLKQSLAPLPFSEEESEPLRLKSELKSIAMQWIKNAQHKAEAINILHRNNSLIQSEGNRLNGIIINLEDIKAKSSELSTQLLKLQTRRNELLGEQTADELTSARLKKEKDLNRQIQTSRDTKLALSSAYDLSRGAIANIRQGIETSACTLAALYAEILEWLDKNSDDFTWESLKTIFSEDEMRIQKEKEHLSALEKQLTVAQATTDERKKQLQKHETDETKPQEYERTDTLTEQLAQTNRQIEQNTNRIAELNAILNSQQQAQERIHLLQKELDAQSILHENWKKLNDLIGSATGTKFKEIAQGYTLDALLLYANRHIRELSGRYELQRIPDTLALQVVDLEMLGEVRTVHSLSGGESFLVSLALALGLSSLSSHRMKIESLFIDEGFDSLDIETLRIAMQALERLQTQGRKIGVISHVPEMIEHIPVRVHVRRISNGKSVIEIENK